MRNKLFPVIVPLLLVVFLCSCSSFNRENMFQKTVLQAGEKVFPALVYIKVVQENMNSGRSSSASASGSGVIISPDGEIVTNHHVIEKAVSIRCLLNDGRAYDAKLIGSDKDTDLALLKLQLPENTPALEYASFAPEGASEGEFVMALGAPWGLNRSISIGIISCTNRYLVGCSEYSLWYQSDAAIAPGNSGGPLINTSGRIVGINTRGISSGGLAFTIPGSTVLTVLPRLRKYGKANWAWFGLRFQPLRDFERNIYLPYKQGVVVAGTAAGSPAQRAGFLVNDLILKIDGESVTAATTEDLSAIYRKLGLVEFGKKIVFVVERDGKTLEISCVAAEKGKVEGDELACSGWGFTAKTINRFDNPELHFYQPDGVFVFGVKSGSSPARMAGLLNGDIILEVNNQKIRNLRELAEAYKNAEKKIDSSRRSRLKIMRNGVTLQMAVNFAEQMENEW